MWLQKIYSVSEKWDNFIICSTSKNKGKSLYKPTSRNTVLDQHLAKKFAQRFAQMGRQYYYNSLDTWYMLCEKICFHFL